MAPDKKLMARLMSAFSMVSGKDRMSVDPR
jgi:hypothetical protein